MRIAAIDIGWVNYSVYVEEFDDIALKETKKTPDHTDTCLISGDVLYWEVTQIAPITKKTVLQPSHFLLLEQYLESLDQLFDTCDYILVENQQSINLKATRCSQHTLSHFVCRYRDDLTRIIPYPATRKTSVLKAPKGMSAYERKNKWPQKKTKEILDMRGDPEWANWVDDHKKNRAQKIKSDDICDTFLMVQAYKIEGV
jgi:hypothetical protein